VTPSALKYMLLINRSGKTQSVLERRKFKRKERGYKRLK